MSPAPISLAWAPGKRLLASAGSLPNYSIQVLPSLPPQFRKLFFASHMPFSSKHLSPLELSSNYRALILDCKQSISEQIDISESHQQLIKSLEQAHSVWHLVEAAWLSQTSRSDRHISNYLAQWHSTNSPTLSTHSDVIIQELQTKGTTPGLDEKIWKTVTKFLIAGNIVEARDLLIERMKEDKHYDSQWADNTAAAQLGQMPLTDDNNSTSPFHQVEAVLGRAPDHRISTRNDGTWEEWQDFCGQWATSEELTTCREAQTILNLLRGDLRGIAEACETWQEMFVACSFYLKDSLGLGGNISGGASRLADICAAASKVYEPPKDIAGGALVEVAMGNLKDAIVRMEASLPSSWFSAHLTDVLVQAQVISDDLNAELDGTDNTSIGIREFYLKEYARELERYGGCWRLAVDYYLECPIHGKSMLVDLLSRVPLEGPGDLTTEKVLAICNKQNLRKTAKRICTKLATEALDRDNLGSAVMWFARAGSMLDVRIVAETALREAEAGGGPSRGARKLDSVVNSLANFGSADMQDSLRFIQTYRDMQSALGVLKYPPKKDVLLSDIGKTFRDLTQELVTGGGLARKYWCIICYDVARIMEEQESISVLFTGEVIEDLLQALELSSGPHRSIELLEGLRTRIASEKAAAQPAQTHTNDLKLADVEEAEKAIEYCRSVFLKAMGLRIDLN